MALTLAEAERLTLLIEECSEVIQAATKILRYGYQSHHPTGEYDNREQLEIELGDVMAIADLMVVNEDIRLAALKHQRLQKMQRLPRWLQQPHKMPSDAP